MPTNLHSSEFNATVLTLKAECDASLVHPGQPLTEEHDAINNEVNSLIQRLRVLRDPSYYPVLRYFKMSQFCATLYIAADKLGGARVGMTQWGGSRIIEFEWHISQASPFNPDFNAFFVTMKDLGYSKLNDHGDGVIEWINGDTAWLIKEVGN